jgi:hypothetical protein
MKKYQYSILAVAIIVCMYACSPALKVTSDYDKSVNFQPYKTFTLDTIKISQLVSQLNQNRIINSVKSEMTKKGFTESSTPDMLVHVTAIVKNEQSTSSTTDFYGYGGGFRPYLWGGGMGATGYTTYNVQDYKDGSLIIDIVDAKSHNLIWEGIGNEEIDKPSKDPDAAIAAAVASILAKYPPGTAKK